MLRKLAIVITVIVAVALFMTSKGETAESDEIRYTYSRDPAVTVLYVGVSAGRNGTTKSMTVYGDGLVELRKVTLTHLEHSYDIHISSDEISRLVQLAVDYKLAEWDETSIEARFARRLGNRRFIPSDAATVRVMLALSSYDRGDEQVKNLRKDMSFSAVQTGIEIAPDVIELEGLKALSAEMSGLWKRAESEQDS